MKWLVTAALAVVGTSAWANDRESQWIYRDRHGDGTDSPTAVFLSWNYAVVVLKAECRADQFGNSGKAGNGAISLYYYPGSTILPDNGKAERPFEPFVFSRGDKSVSFPATATLQVVSGNISVTAELLAVLKPGKDDLEIEATNEMDEPWYVGQAEPLYRLAQACAEK